MPSYQRTLGKSLAGRFLAEVAKAAGLADGQRVEVVMQEITIEEMFRGKSAEQWPALYSDAYDWGPDAA